MDPSLSISNDPQHHHPPPPQFAGFPFATGNPFAGSQGLPFFAGAVNNHIFQVPPPTQPPQPPAAPVPEPAAPLPQHPSVNHPPYSDMICSAIAALNEPDGSSKQAISRYIERTYPGLPPAHGALLTHHLKTLKNTGVLVMVKKSYKFASTAPPTSVAVAAAAAATGLEGPRSDLPSYTTNELPQLEQTGLPVATSASAPTALKRGRGRPPKPKPDSQPSEAPIQPNGQPQTNWEQYDMSVSKPAEEVQPTRRPAGRPRKNGPAVTPTQVSATDGIVKRRGRPPGRRAAGRQRKPKSVAGPATVYAYVANGTKRRGRPRKVDSGFIVAPSMAEGGEAAAAVAVLPAKRRGRPPKIGGVIRKPMKPRRGVSRTGRPVGRPRKNAQWPKGGSSGQHDAGYGELKRKFDFLQEKVKEAVNVLKTEVTIENQAVFQALEELEGLTAMDTSEPHGVGEVMPQEPNPETEARAETQAQAQTDLQGQAQAQTEAEAMQEALF